MKEPPQSLEEVLFELAVQRPAAEERAAFLDGVCRDNPALRARLDVLLEGHFGGAGFLLPLPKGEGWGEGEGSVRAPSDFRDLVPDRAETVPAPQSIEGPAQTIGRYKLLEKIGEGGFGEV